MNTPHKAIVYSAPSDISVRNQLSCYVDASHADFEDLRPTIGFVLFFNNGPITWRSCLAKTVCYSPNDSEYTALFASTSEVIAHRNVSEEIGLPYTSPTVVYEDNSGVIAIANQPKSTKSMRYLELKKHLSRASVANGTIVLVKIHTSDQIADIFTKPLASAQFKKLAAQLVV